MPKGTHVVRKRGPGKYEIVKKLAGGKTRVVGHSKRKKDAKASARIRDRKSKSERR